MMTEQAKVPAIRFAGFTDPWEQRKLEDIANRVTRKNEGESDLPLTISSQYGLVDQRTFFNNQVASKDMSGYYLLRKGEFAYNKSTSGDSPWGAVKRLVRYEKGCVSTLYICFGLDGADPDFLVTYYETDRWYKAVQMIAAEGARNHGLLNIAPNDFFDTALILPPSREEQELIGLFFARLDRLITLHQRKYDKLVVFKKSMLEKMFPKDGESVPEIRFAGFTDPWEQRKFVDFVEASGIRNKDNLQLESYSVSNDRGFVPQDEQFENGGTMRDADKTAYWIVEPGSFAYNPARINVGSIGYQSTRKNVIVSSLYEVFKTDRSCDDRFLWHWFKSSLFTKQIEMLQEGGVRLYFFFDKLQKSEIWMPNVDEQRIIGQQFDQLDSLITLHQRKLELLQNIKKSLLDKMFA
ncbi:restriction endonuclease subunit S [Bifidobacterium longum]|nr:restriction endonuclease subunit S [Bifidobacterium longum]